MSIDLRAVARELHDRLNDDGGFTWHPDAPNGPNDGFLVGGFVSEVKVRTCTVDTIHDFLATNIEEINEEPFGDLFFGGWQGPKFVHLDISYHLLTLDEAIEHAVAAGELEVYDVTTGKSIKVNWTAQ